MKEALCENCKHSDNGFVRNTGPCITCIRDGDGFIEVGGTFTDNYEPNGEPAGDIAHFVHPFDMHLVDCVELERSTFPMSRPAWEVVDPKKLIKDLEQALKEINTGPKLWHEHSVKDLVDMPPSDKYTKTAGREVSFCPKCGFRWWQPHQRKNLFGNHFALWKCRKCNIKVTRVSNESGVRLFIEPIIIPSVPRFTITGTWTI
jgi:ssDNA-binding Zn-finger/Zn-ribbon topoisomerase 1